LLWLSTSFGVFRSNFKSIDSVVARGVRFATLFLVGRGPRFPLHIQSTRKLTMSERLVVTVIDKAFWDVGHAPKDQSNRRKYMPDYAVWEIHPVMKLRVQ
jgi:hypothetical protein